MTIRNYLKEGDVLAFRYYDTAFMKLIRIGNWLEFGKEGWTNGITHIAVISGFGKENGKACALVSEALETGVTTSPYELDWLDNQITNGVISVYRPREQIHNLSQFCKQYEGKPYDFFSIVAMGYNILTGCKLLGYDKLKGPSKQFCMEFVLRVLYDASNKVINLEKELNKDFDMIMPNYITKSDSFIKIR
jgi:hypothetical protein